MSPAVIHKEKFSKRYKKPHDIYKISMKFCLERTYRYLYEQEGQKSLCHVVVEQRGHSEDKELAMGFSSICQGENIFNRNLPFELVLSDKKVNSSGLQLADLFARPIGLHILKPQQPNRAFELIKQKIRCDDYGEFFGYGLKVFP